MQIIDCLQEDYNETQKEVKDFVARCKHILDRLNEMALQKDPLSEVGYIDMLIQLEERLGKEGWQKRVQELYEVKKMAERMKNVQDGKDFLRT